MRRIVIPLIFIALALGLGYWFGQRAAVPSQSIVATKRQVFVCPMHAHIVQDRPGLCPICAMDLVDSTGSATPGANQIQIDAATQAKLGVRLARAEPTALSREIATYATLIPDQSAVQRITANVDGVLTKLHIKRVGQRIAEGQLLYELSSQDALNLQYEYIDVLRRGTPVQNMAENQRRQNRKAREAARALEPAAREQVEKETRQSDEQALSILQPLQRDRHRVVLRLKQIGFTDAMLKKLASSGQALSVIQARAQRPCVVKEILAHPGMQIGRMTEIVSCVDNAQAWLELVLYPDQLAWVREGDAVTAEFDDGAAVKTRLTGLSPVADGVARTVRARFAIDLNRAATLGEYAAVTIHTSPRQTLAVPSSAVLRSGRGNTVMRAMGNGHFMPVKVVTGIENTEQVAILDGLQAGDEVAVNGQFLLDAAASINDAAQRLKGPG